MLNYKIGIHCQKYGKLRKLFAKVGTNLYAALRSQDNKFSSSCSKSNSTLLNLWILVTYCSQNCKRFWSKFNHLQQSAWTQTHKDDTISKTWSSYICVIKLEMIVRTFHFSFSASPLLYYNYHVNNIADQILPVVSTVVKKLGLDPLSVSSINEDFELVSNSSLWLNN